MQNVRCYGYGTTANTWSGWTHCALIRMLRSGDWPSQISAFISRVMQDALCQLMFRLYLPELLPAHRAPPVLPVGLEPACGVCRAASKICRIGGTVDDEAFQLQAIARHTR